MLYVLSLHADVRDEGQHALQWTGDSGSCVSVSVWVCVSVCVCVSGCVGVGVFGRGWEVVLMIYGMM